MIDKDMIKAEFDNNENLQCPNCKGDQFRNGPEGGMSKNIECSGCNARWNWLTGLDLLEPINDIAEAFTNKAVA